MRIIKQLCLTRVAALALVAGLGLASAAYTEEVHQTYPLTPTGSVSLSNVNGNVRIQAWDRNEVKLDAIKRGDTKETVDEVKVEVESSADRIRIRTRYPERSWSDENRKRGSATVEYSLMVPRTARMEEINLVNGNLVLEGVTGAVSAKTVNGNIQAQSLGGRVELKTVNGGVQADLNQLDPNQAVDMDSVNGAVRLLLPASASASVSASTVHGAITNAFGMQVEKGRWVGSRMEGTIGSGGAKVRLKTVNGKIEVERSGSV
jgi:DUF4097 and DUF4098 domain-containing protein YvlB